MFDKVFIIGSGSICINIIKSLQQKGLKPIVLLYKEHQMSPLSMFLASKNIEHYIFNERTPLSVYLEKIEERSLIISANNIFLFPAAVVEKENLKIVNFHNALLPAHRGMNAPTWTIFEQDKKAGITWHLVNKNIDDGAIIIQKSIDLDQTETALVLIRKLMNLAFGAYKEIEDSLLGWRLSPSPMPSADFYQIHYAKDVPNNGLLNIHWSIAQMDAFLRSLDWGCVDQFARPKIEIDGELQTINNYKLVHQNKLEIVTEKGHFVLETTSPQTPVSLGGGYFLRNFFRLLPLVAEGRSYA